MTGGIVSVLIPAVGGQGGGVLMEWIVDAALVDGLSVHGTSIPGVAQRTGSTTYYVELFTERGAPEPAFSLYPIPGALDVLLAPELLEVGRMIEQGFVSPERTTVICSTHRLYSIHEKIATGRAIYPADQLERAAAAAARRLIAFDALAIARARGTEANAVLLGALAGSGVLPIRADAFRRAIETKGVLVRANLAGFEAGVTIARGEGADAAPARVAAVPDLPRRLARAADGFPDPLRDVVRRALARLVDYQDARYAHRYLERLAAFVPAPGAPAVRMDIAVAVARALALWMSYEDAVRVADLKTRASRFERIRAESRARNGVVQVTDYLKPDLDEIWGVLPYRIVAPFAAWARRRWPHGRPALGQHVRTTTISGFVRVRALTLLRRWRPISYRAREEQARIERWLDGVRAALRVGEAAALELARAGQLVKGYGDVRRRLAGLLETLLDATRDAGALEEARGGDGAITAAFVAQFRALVLEGPDGEARALALAAETVAQLRAGTAAGARVETTV